jgi:hypothetical protein
MAKARRWSATIAGILSVIGFFSVAQAGNWWETIKVKGDLRYRHEMIDEQDKDARHRQRLRARIGFFGEVSPYTKVEIQLATGSDDPVSTNQTLGDAFTTKRVGVDLAYFEAYHDQLPGLTLTGGKFDNPFFKPGKSELIWDSDWNPEGGTANFTRDFDNITLTLVGAGLWINERSSLDDSWLAAGQGIVRFHFNAKKSSVALGGGLFNYVNTQGFRPFYDEEDPYGNTVNTVAEVDNGDTTYYEAYANEYELFEAFGEFTHAFGQIPVTVMADYVNNTAADSLQTGWLVGFHVGKAKKPGSWELRYVYREVEPDAVVGIFTDSDFRGGGTDAKGHEFGGGLQLADNTTFSVTYFINEIGLQAADSQDFSRLQVDLQLKF